MGEQDARAARTRAEGWAWGTTDGGEWLTIAGSALERAALAETPEDAVPPPPILGSTQILAKVARHGDWFRILERAPADRQHHLITVPDDGPWQENLTRGWCACSVWRWDHEAQRSVFVSGWRSPAAARMDIINRAYERHLAAAQEHYLAEIEPQWTEVPGSRVCWMDNSVEVTQRAHDGRTRTVQLVAPHGDLC